MVLEAGRILWVGRRRMDQPLEGKDYSFPKQEEITLKFWEDTDAFQQQLKLSEGKDPYIFFDGVRPKPNSLHVVAYSRC